MRREKSYTLYYVIAAVVLIAAGVALVHEVPLTQEHVEEVLK